MKEVIRDAMQNFPDGKASGTFSLIKSSMNN